MAEETQHALDGETLVDSHCHLDYLHRRKLGIADVVQRAAQAGVSHLLTVATEVQYDPLLAGFCQQHAAVFRSVGVHPCHVQNEPRITRKDLLPLVDAPGVVALGESGLDYFHDTRHATLQQALFREHLAVAQETDLPIIIHTRASDEDTINIVQQAYRQKPFRGVFHCYTGSESVLKAAREMDFYVSLTGILTYRTSRDLCDIVPKIPLERLMVETDAPYLSPVPHRSKPCEPWMVVHTAARLAEVLGMPLADIARITTQNFFRLFHRATPS